MPIITPNQKVKQTKMFGDDLIEVVLVGDTFDDCAVAAKAFTEKNGMTLLSLRSMTSKIIRRAGNSGCRDPRRAVRH